MFETFLLLTSSFTIGLGIHAMRLGRQKAMIGFLSITLILGLGFLGVEIYEFVQYVHVGATIQTSAFLSSSVNNTRTHGAHVTLGLFWGIFILMQIKKRGIDSRNSQ